MGAYRFVRDEPRNIVWHDLASGGEVQTMNLGTVATLQPGDHVIGRRVASAGEPLFDAAPLPVSERVARAVADSPAEWVSALGDRGDEPVGPRVRRGAWRGGPSGLLTDLPDSVWQDLARLHRRSDEPGAPGPVDSLVAGCLGLVLSGIEDAVIVPPTMPVRDPWPVVGAALEHPGVWECLLDRLDEDYEMEEIAVLGERLGGPVGRALCSLTILFMARSR